MTTITIETNRSGRMWAEDPSAWARLWTPKGARCGGRSATPNGS
jgi:hypothetical protein